VLFYGEEERRLLGLRWAKKYDRAEVDKDEPWRG
jgi:hypothetical protein